jgi:glycosyltransferase involved in cell wall biosynthesis
VGDSTTDLMHRPFRVLVGDLMAPSLRQAVQSTEQPRIDVLEMESRLGGGIHDFAALSSATGRCSRLLAWCARRTGLWSEFTALHGTVIAPTNAVLYATGEDVGLISALVLRLLRRRGVRLIVRLEHMDYGRSPTRATIHRVLMRTALSRIDVVLCRTRRHVERLSSEYGVDPSRVRFVPQPVDARFFDQGHITDADSGSQPARPYIVSAGMEMRDYATLVEAARGLPIDVVIGAGSPWSKQTYDTGGDLPANVTVASYSPTQMRRLYHGARIVVVPIKPTSRACGMNVVLEAWSMGRPVVASRTEGLVSYVVDRHNGVLAEPNDPEDLRAKIEMVLTDAALARRIGEEGRRCTLDSLTVDRYVDTVAAEIAMGS